MAVTAAGLAQAQAQEAAGGPFIPFDDVDDVDGKTYSITGYSAVSGLPDRELVSNSGSSYDDAPLLTSIADLEADQYAPEYSNFTPSEIDALVPGVSRVRNAAGRVMVLSENARKLPYIQIANNTERDALIAGFTAQQKADFHGTQVQFPAGSFQVFNAFDDTWRGPAFSLVGNPQTSPDLFTNSWVPERASHLPDLLDYGVSETDGAANAEAFKRCIEENLSFTITNPGFIIPISDDIEIRPHCHIVGQGNPAFMMEADTYFGWDGLGKTEGLVDWTLKGVKFWGDATRTATAPIVRFESDRSFNGVTNTNPVGEDCRRFKVYDLEIEGTDKNGLGIALLGVYTGLFVGLQIRQVHTGYKIDKGTRTNYGANGISFISYEIQGVIKVGNIADVKRCYFQGVEQGADIGVDLVGPAEGIYFDVYHELVGKSSIVAEQYSFYIDKGPLNSDKLVGIFFAPSCYFVAPVFDNLGAPMGLSTGAIRVKGAVGIEINGTFLRYQGPFVVNESTVVDDVIGFVNTVIGDFDNPWSTNEFLQLENPTAKFYAKNYVHRQDVSEITNTAGADTVLGSFEIPSLGFNQRAEPVIIKMNGYIGTATGINKQLKIRIDDGISPFFVPALEWNTTEDENSFMFELHVNPKATAFQLMYAKAEGFGDPTGDVNSAETNVNTTTKSLIIEIIGNCATAGVITKYTFSYDTGKK